MIGLIIYQSANGIVGLEAHFGIGTPSQLSGSRDSCALYFCFQPGEQIAHACLYVQNMSSMAFATQSLIVYFLLFITLYTYIGTCLLRFRFKQLLEEHTSLDYLYSLR
jgi:hypothetical protein